MAKRSRQAVRVRHEVRMPRAARGSVLVLVLGVSLLIAVLGLAAITTARTQRASAEDANDVGSARQLAQSAIDLALARIGEDSNWRKSMPDGTWVNQRTVGGGSLSTEVTDADDGAIGDWPYDDLTIRGTGTQGDAVYVLEVTLQPYREPLDALRCAIHSAGELRIRSTMKLTATGGPASTNGELRNEGTLTGNVEAASLDNRATITGTITVPAPAKPLPPTTVVDLYADIATAMSAPSTINTAAIGPGFNPYGGANPNGVYKITSAGSVTIRNTRLLGTLVVRVPGQTLTLDGFVLFENFRSDYPVLIVEGNLNLNFNGGPTLLSEVLLLTNLNPPGVPYGGGSDFDILDSYVSQVRGLVYVTGTISVEGKPQVDGAVLTSQAVDIDDQLVIQHDAELYSNPPLGFEKLLEMRIEPGSWRRVTLP